MFNFKNPSNRTLELILASVVLLRRGQKEIMANVNDVKTAVATLATDVSAEIQAAKDAILRAQAGDPAALQEVVDSLNAIDTAVNDAKGTFNGTNPPVA